MVRTALKIKREILPPLLVLMGFISPAHSQSGGERMVLSYRVDVQNAPNSSMGQKLSGLIVIYFERDTWESANLDPLLGVMPSAGYGDWAERPNIKSCDLKITTISLASKDGSALTRTATFTLNRSNGGYQGEFDAVYKDDNGRTVVQERGRATVNVVKVNVRKK